MVSIKNKCLEVLASNLLRIRKERGISRKDLASAAGVTVDSISGYESAKRLAPLNVIFAMADYLGVSVVSLTGDNDNNLDVPDANKIINDYRFDQATKLAVWSGFVVAPTADGKVFLIPSDETIRNADGSSSLNVDISKVSHVFPFDSLDEFVKFIEAVENFAVNTDAPFRSTLSTLLHRKNIT